MGWGPPGGCRRARGWSGRRRSSRPPGRRATGRRCRGWPAPTAAPTPTAARYAWRSSVLMLILATPRLMAPLSCSSGRPLAPCSTSGTGTASRIAASRSRSRDTGVLVRPWTLPTATARASTPVRATNSAASCRVGHGLGRRGVDGHVLVTRHGAQLGFDPGPGRVGQRHRGPGELDVVLEGQMGPVDHHRAVAGLDALLDLGQVPAVVEVDPDRRVRLAGGVQGDADQRGPPGVVEVAGPGEHDHRAAGLLRGGDDRLHHLEVVGGEGRHRRMLGDRVRQDLGAAGQHVKRSAAFPRRRPGPGRRRRSRRTRCTGCPARDRTPAPTSTRSRAASSPGTRPDGCRAPRSRCRRR